MLVVLSEVLVVVTLVAGVRFSLSLPRGSARFTSRMRISTNHKEFILMYAIGTYLVMIRHRPSSVTVMDALAVVAVVVVVLGSSCSSRSRHSY